MAAERAASSSEGEGASASAPPESPTPETPAYPTLPQPNSTAPPPADASDSQGGAAAQNGIPPSEGVPGEGVPTVPPVVASSAQLACSVRQVQEIMSGGVASFLAVRDGGGMQYLLTLIAIEVGEV